jgi:hypothetical protein
VDVFVIALVRTALAVVTARLLTLMGLWMAFGLAAWAMYAPSMERLYIAVGFAVLVYIPSLTKETRGPKKEPARERSQQQEQPE